MRLAFNRARSGADGFYQRLVSAGRGFSFARIGAAAPEAPVSVIREEAVHVSPGDFLRGGVLEPKPFTVRARHAAWVFLGGALGAAARLLLEGVGSYLTPLHAVFPFGTMVANVAGSFAIAIFGTLLFERFVGERERMFWVLGFLGSLTTFSSYVQQTAEGWEASPFRSSRTRCIGSVLTWTRADWSRCSASMETSWCSRSDPLKSPPC